MLKTTKKIEKMEEVHFDRVATEYENKYGYNDKFTKYKINKKIGRFVDFIKSGNNQKRLKILEIGCGTGTYTYKFASKLPFVKIEAVDISKSMIKIAKSRLGKQRNISYSVKSAYKTSYNDSSFDVVCGFYVLHHLNTQAVIKEIHRVLKPGGLVYFYEPNILNPIVFLIKSNKYIKKIIGDSSEEWAINPLKIASQMKGFVEIGSETSEFIWPISFIPYKVKVFFDKLFSIFISRVPGINLIGGSIELRFIKRN